MSYQIEQTILLRDYLKKLPISQAMIKRIKREGDFLVNGKSETVRCLLQKGDCLEIIFPIENSNIQPENIPLKIIYEDDVCIAFLDLSQATYGHTLVIPKKHFENILEAFLLRPSHKYLPLVFLLVSCYLYPLQSVLLYAQINLDQ